jgi:hypothetical protein
MADIREAILARLRESEALEAVVGTRIYPEPRPQRDDPADLLPCVEYQVVSNINRQRIAGRTGIVYARIQFDLLALDLKQCTAMKAAIEACLDGYRGTVANIEIARAEQQEEQDLAERLDDGSDQVLRRVSVDYQVKYRTEIPTFP